MGKRIILLFASLGLLLGCGLRSGNQPRPGSQPQPEVREFPRMEVPAMLSDIQDRMSWIAEHFWDGFTRTDKCWHCDSVTVNGVDMEQVEAQMGVFATLLEQASPADGKRGMEALYSRIAAFQQAFPEANVFPEMVRLTEFYFYDPNSPVRSEELYLPFVSLLAESGLVDPARRPAYAWAARMCALNRPGTPAADFDFIDTKGRQRTLYGIRAEWTLLVFGNPDCNACKELTADISGDEYLNGLVREGTLQVVDIYIDEDIDAWKERMEAYPKDWINGYDPKHIIREDLIYNIRAVPSLYLLDKEKRVVLKDATPEQVFSLL